MTNNSTEHKPILALPATAEETVEKVDVNDTYKLKELGPVGKSFLFLLFFFLTKP